MQWSCQVPKESHMAHPVSDLRSTRQNAAVCHSIRLWDCSVPSSGRLFCHPERMWGIPHLQFAPRNVRSVINNSCWRATLCLRHGYSPFFVDRATARSRTLSEFLQLSETRCAATVGLLLLNSAFNL